MLVSFSSSDKKMYDLKDLEKYYFSKTPLQFWYDRGFTKEELLFNSPPDLDEFKNSEIKRYFFGYFHKWSNHENYYYAKENTGLTENPERTEGTYTRYSSFDDKTDGFHQWYMLVKFGFGRCTDDASQEIRNNHITREEAQVLVKRFDGEFPDKYFNEIMDYIQMKPSQFHRLCNKFRSPHLWKKVVRYNIYGK